MVAAAEDWLRKRDVPKLQLLVHATNDQVLAFYDRLACERSDVRVIQKWLRDDDQPDW